MKRIGIFCGGYSSEFEISMKSAQTILNHFPSVYQAVMIEVTRDGWYAHDRGQRLEFDPWQLSWKSDGNTQNIDAALVYIHGNPGENGKMQAYFEMRGIPFLNSGALASELSFDKWYCNQFLKGFGIPVAHSIYLKDRSEAVNEEIIQNLGLPCFVKPVDSGSSYGISKVSEAGALDEALDKAFAEGKTVVVESFMPGTEVTCGVYRNSKGLVALPLTEIVSENDFFDYEAKYLGKSKEITPARVDESIREAVQQTARKVYELLSLRSIARIDFMLVDNVPHVIEVNTTPGFSPASIVPQMLAAAEIEIRDFWKEIIEQELAW